MPAPSPKRSRAPVTPFLLLPLLATMLQAYAETKAPPSTEGPNIFIGDTARLSIGTSGAGRMHGEISGVLHETSQQAWLGELWLGQSAGGAKLSHHRLLNDTVHKIFVAHDQNATRDHKFTIGYGQERSSWFGNINLSLGTTGRRLVGDQTTTVVTQENGSTPTGTYTDTLTQTTQTRFFDRAYNQGIGFRAGRYSEDLDLRLSVGYDHERGTGRARQDTVSLIAEKGFTGTPHSVGVQLSHKNRSGDVSSTGGATTQAMLTYRMSLGGVNHRPEKRFLVTSVQPPVTPSAVTSAALAHPTPQPAAAGAAPKTASAAPAAQAAPAVQATTKELRWVKTKATMSSDALFGFNSAALTPASRSELDRIANLLQQQGREGNIRITGHTCDIGSDRVNDRLSLQRAESVRSYLVGNGAVPADAVLVSGKGKREQKFPATEATRAQNRRVELEFFTFTNQQEWVEVPLPAVAAPAPVAVAKPAPAPVAAPAPAPVVYERSLVDQPPAWSQRALRTPALHKREVDVYRVKEERTTETKTRQWTNSTPTAKDDAYQLSAGSTTNLNVLSNDTDPDSGDAITLVSFTGAKKGALQISGQSIVYTANPDYVGEDDFSYTIKDSKGLTSTANVKISLTKANRAPLATQDTFWVSGRTPSTLNVLANDTDPDGDTLRIVSVTQPIEGVGAVEIVGNELKFTPSRVFGVDTFSYTISDNRGATATTTVLLIDP
ncbi:Ig-like domain-containing protein [Limnohabitans sp.]|uniref:Ig-like domain-containing protein n=1 Tax=Limnohabitans sp. TaxID=1907725 RepID=UPI0025C044EA|nr:Ig-like domain-containing protein [Limnohabitans sp.]